MNCHNPKYFQFFLYIPMPMKLIKQTCTYTNSYREHLQTANKQAYTK